jgi:protein-tyrosine phosphatase
LSDQPVIHVLFVCMGNICRSPTAQGVFSKLVIEEGLGHQIEIDSAGTHAYHVGELPDPRARATAQRRGIDLSRQRARRAIAEDFERFDYVLAMDEDNHRALLSICPPDRQGRLRLFMDYAPQLDIREVPDPYYGGANGFEAVFDMVEEASRGLLEAIRREHLSTSRPA